MQRSPRPLLRLVRHYSKGQRPGSHLDPRLEKLRTLLYSRKQYPHQHPRDAGAYAPLRVSSLDIDVFLEEVPEVIEELYASDDALVKVEFEGFSEAAGKDVDVGLGGEEPAEENDGGERRDGSTIEEKGRERGTPWRKLKRKLARKALVRPGEDKFWRRAASTTPPFHLHSPFRQTKFDPGLLAEMEADLITQQAYNLVSSKALQAHHLHLSRLYYRQRQAMLALEKASEFQFNACMVNRVPKHQRVFIDQPDQSAHAELIDKRRAEQGGLKKRLEQENSGSEDRWEKWDEDEYLFPRKLRPPTDTPAAVPWS